MFSCVWQLEINEHVDDDDDDKLAYKSDSHTGIASGRVWCDCRSLVPEHRVHSGRWRCTANNWRREPAYGSITSNNGEN